MGGVPVMLVEEGFGDAENVGFFGNGVFVYEDVCFIYFFDVLIRQDVFGSAA